MRFSKWHALGNSYLLLERSDLGRPLDPELARRLCDVRVGVGADGVLEVLESDTSSASVAIWNPDGSPAEFSGNGTRIAAAWLARRGGVDSVSISVGERRYAAALAGDGLVEAAIGPVEVRATETIDVAGERVELTPVSVGNPHAVVRREPRREALLRLGPLLERHEQFPRRTNVQFIRVDGPHDVTAIVWERGAGETSASGSSAVAVAAASIVNGWCESPVRVRFPGGELDVVLDVENNATLTGPAEEICEGEVLSLPRYAAGGKF
jgi:diaminopimelate epimerase